ncbi:hypothetical protein CPB84DRAFT_1761367 [Gymnopilus junonius]|uniref:SH3 domain-containing protein n=1 Tax=Gymnopilus junonius TaxID=109634 RepID=A0A9P5P1A8_GYMJU|nr:hypothetical protein CPB84DRAFT_1761367 [Gymnopilus junonius]
MHSKRLRRRLHAAQWGAVVVGGLTLTGPITLTLISTLPSSTQSSTSLSSTSNTVQSTMTLTSSSSSSSTTSNAASQTPSTSTPPALLRGALSTTKIPAGGIVGVVIGCLIVPSRANELRNTWTTRNAPVGIRSSQYEPKPFVGDSVSSDMSPEMRFAPPPPQMHPNPLAITSYRVLSPTSVYSPTSAAISPSSATVVCTFIVGEIVRILAEYDDGWVLCMNADGEQGMVPLECLSRGRPTASSDGARRVSSLGPSARP